MAEVRKIEGMVGWKVGKVRAVGIRSGVWRWGV